MPDYMRGGEPFYFAGNHIGCLLIHGFTGTPYEMHELGQRLSAKGYTVLGPALAGHATTLSAMLPTRWTDWYTSVTTAYDQLHAHCDTIFPIGLSLGGLLCLHLAAHRPVNGVVAVSAPFSIQHSLIPLFKFFPFLFELIPAIQKNPKDNDTVDPTVGVNHPEYPAQPTRGAASLVFDLLPHLHDDLRDICVPTLLIQSHGDHVIPANSMDEFYARISSRNKEMVWLDKSGHLVLEDYSKEIAFTHILQFIEANIEKISRSTTVD